MRNLLAPLRLISLPGGGGLADFYMFQWSQPFHGPWEKAGSKSFLLPPLRKKKATELGHQFCHDLELLLSFCRVIKQGENQGRIRASTSGGCSLQSPEPKRCPGQGLGIPGTPRALQILHPASWRSARSSQETLGMLKGEKSSSSTCRGGSHPAED